MVFGYAVFGAFLGYIIRENLENNQNYAKVKLTENGHHVLSDLNLLPNVSSWKVIPKGGNYNNHFFSSPDFKTDHFANIFQQCAPYIAMHRGSKIVIHIPSHVFSSRETFDAIMDDLSILHLLGVQLVLVASVKTQIDDCMKSLGLKPENFFHNGIRITDERSLQCLKEASGSVRSAIESSLARGFRGLPGVSGINVVSGNFFYSAKPVGVREGVDFKYTGEVRRIEVDNLARRLEQGDVILLTSLGYSSSGEVFNVPSESLASVCAAQLGASKIIFLTEGQVLVEESEDEEVNVIQSLRLPQAVALLRRFGLSPNTSDQIEVDKLSQLASASMQTLSKSMEEAVAHNQEQLHHPTPKAHGLPHHPAHATSTQNGGHPYPNGQPDTDHDAGLEPIADADVMSQGSGQEGTSGDLYDLERERDWSGVAVGVVKGAQQEVSLDHLNEDGAGAADGGEGARVMGSTLRIIARSVQSLMGGVRRAHLVPPLRGSLLKELYTSDGSGLLISRDVYEGIRKAQASDLRSIEEIIAPLVTEGVLIPRSRDQLENDLQDSYVVTRDGIIVGLGMLKRFGPHHAEVCCLAVHPAYRRYGRGETLLAYLERTALMMGVSQVFVLSTRTMQWFEERGFIPTDPSRLPESRKYDKSRGSKVYMKALGTLRDVDGQELLWNL